MSSTDIVTDNLAVSFPEFGHPTSSALFQEAKRISSRISGPETHAVNTSNGVLSTRVFSPIEFQSSKGEDRIFTGFVDNIPLLVIADEASDVVTSSGAVLSGGGGKAAQEAILGSLEVISDQLKEGLDSPRIYEIIQNGFTHAAAKIKEKNLSGRTTLIISFLYFHGSPKKGGSFPVWYYASIGNGRLSLGSPSRKPTGWTTESNLLTSRDMGTTPTIGANGLPFPPEIGTRVYSPDDFLVGATDGIDGPMVNMWNQKKLLLPNLVEKANPSDASFSHRLVSAFRGLHFSDDAVLGIIVTTNLRK